MMGHPEAFRTPATAAEILRAYHVAKSDARTLPATVNRLWNSYLEAVKADMERNSDGESNIA